VRAEIIAAAQRLLDRNGTTGFTLSAVAGEAELPRATIYTHFSSRHDLLAQLSQPEADGEVAAQSNPADGEQTPPVAEDISPPPEDSSPAEKAAPGIEEAPPSAEEPATVASDAPVDAPVEAETPAASTDVPLPDTTAVESGYGDMMRAQAQALDHLTKRVIIPKSMRREGTDTVISRIEARLSVAEQSVAALEKSLAENLKRAGDPLAALAASLEETRQRLAKFEERQQASIAQLRLDVHNLGRRGEAAPVAEAAMPQAAEAVFVPDPPLPSAEEVPPMDEQPAPVRVQEYLSSARHAAILAAQQSAVKPKSTPRAARLKLLQRWRWPLIGVAAVVVAAFDLYVFTHYQPARAAVVPAAQTAVMGAPARHRVLTPEAQLKRGLLFLNGSGVATDVEKAAKWFERAAAQGQPVAQNYLGVLYQTGTGVHANMATAVRWYEAAARNGNLKAMTNLGKAYAGGWAEGTDYAKAAEWFGRAAGFGDVDAQFDLAVLYERGAGVSRNVADAYKWYVIAGTHGDANAAERASVLSSQLSANELLAAQAAAALFRPAKTDSAANDVPR